MDGKGEADGAGGADDRSRGGGLASLLTLVLCVALVALAVRTFAFSLFTIPSESMLPQLMPGDTIAAKKWPFGYSSNSLPFDLPLIPGRWFAHQPQRGDIVIFKHPVDGTDYVKRVIGLPGDEVAMRNGFVVLNGQVLSQASADDAIVAVSPNSPCGWGGREEARAAGGTDCQYRRNREYLPSGVSYEVLDFGRTPQDNWGPREVPAGTMFLLGDNRDNSMDSRFPALPGGGIGFVSQSLLVGKPGTVLWSFDGTGEWLDPESWPASLRRNRTGKPL
ncbi:signal peptidase I [Alteriqipengyuania lutimaris]|uniref:Signal peptidase I n=1 Tax=Alteriqipengyuania lutimaris TaxID=1538146 RepID=A0A395LNJ9_9SPHN|nr:signal peptidase I [Alteriqipengyuania lutimaris]MBB3032656.1 signal peptidase I [Alteriqipengyuania lutimaris]RDS78229.1 signal peptidase I [Alteriqipengyuania lutimaris]